MKKPYEKPRIIHTEKLEVRGFTPCLKSSDADGPCGAAIAN